jgi:hypothetical protein
MVSNRHFQPKNALSFNYYSAHTTNKKGKGREKKLRMQSVANQHKKKTFPY